MGDWLQTGAGSAALQQQDREEFEQRSKEFKLPYRFFISGIGQSTEITFIDGDLDRDGNLTPPRFFEHTIKNGEGRLVHYICPKRTDPQRYTFCPLCNSGDRASLIAIFTVIDHTQYPHHETGELVGDRVRLFAAKPQVFDLLAYQAKQHGGLACGRFRVSRLGEKSSGVGDTFELLEKEERQKLRNRYWRVVEPTQEDLDHAAQEGLPEPKARRVTNFEAVNYGEAFPFYDGDQLASMGLGQVSSVPNQQGRGFNNGQAFQKKQNYVPPSQQEDDTNYDVHL